MGHKRADPASTSKVKLAARAHICQFFMASYANETMKSMLAFVKLSLRKENLSKIFFANEICHRKFALVRPAQAWNFSLFP